jgi:hypothetical protein
LSGRPAGRQVAAGKSWRSPTKPEPSCRLGAVTSSRVVPSRHVVLAALVLYPVLAVLLAVRLGPDVQWDSAVYASAARSLATEGRLVDFNGHELTVFAPGLPVLLALTTRIGVSIQVATVLLDVVGVAAYVLLTYLVGSSVLRSRRSGLLCAGVVAASSSTLTIFVGLATEPLFMVLSMTALLLVVRVCQRGRLGWWQLVSIGAIVSAATTVRFVGFTLIPVTCLGVYLATRDRTRTRCLALVAAAGAASVVGLLLVAARNVGLGSAPLGPRNASGQSDGTIISDTLSVLGRWTALASGWFAVLLGLVILGIARMARSRDAPALVVGSFVAVYWPCLWLSELTTTITPVGVRMAAPAFAPMVIVVAYAVRGMPWGRWSTARVLGGAVLAASVSLSVLSGVGFAVVAARHGLDYNSVAERSSPLAAAVDDLPADAGVAAFDGPELYWTTGRTDITPVPWVNFYNRRPAALAQLAELEHAARSGRVDYVVAFDTDVDSGAFTPQELVRAGIPLREVRHFADGSLWAVDR